MSEVATILRPLVPRGLFYPLGRLADPSVPRETRLLGREASPALGEEVDTLGTDCPSLGIVRAPVGGRLARSRSFWFIITYDPFI